MARQEYFINAKSETLSSDTKGFVRDAKDIPSVFFSDANSDMIIKVSQKDIERGRNFCYRAYDFRSSIWKEQQFEDPTKRLQPIDFSTDGIPYSMLLIEDGTRFLTPRLHEISFRDNMFPIALTCNRNENFITFACLFYGEEATFRHCDLFPWWWPIGPCAFIKITGTLDQDETSYQVYYNQYELSGEFKCRKHDDVMMYYRTLGINWLENTLEYRNDYLERLKKLAKEE